MKGLLLFFFMLPAAVQARAWTAADSARVRIETSAGAEIGIDGDMSSTNILTKKVACGSHTVTVTFGSGFTRDYDITVTRDETFEFYIDGKLTVSSVPDGRKVYVDGIERGRTPLDISIVGDHNVRVEGDAVTWFDATDRVSVNPFEPLSRSYTLGRRPPRTYGMVMVNYSEGGPGLFLGLCKKFGGYLRINTSFKEDKYNYSWDDKDDMPHGQACHEPETVYNMFALGLMARCHKYVYAYAGGGYGQYLKQFDDPYRPSSYFAPYGSEGALLDVGIILKWKALLLSGGYTRFLGSCNPKQYHELNVGVGFTIHRNKKESR